MDEVASQMVGRIEWRNARGEIGAKERENCQGDCEDVGEGKRGRAVAR